MKQPSSARAVPVRDEDRLGLRLRQLRPDDAKAHGDRRLRRAARRAGREAERGELMGIGVSFFTEAVGAGPRKHMDILGPGMNDGASCGSTRPARRRRISVQTQGQGHETTFAQIVAEELGIPPEDIDVVHGDTDQTPYGLGTYGSRSTPVSGGGGAGRAQGARQGAADRSDDARGRSRGPGMGEGPLVRRATPSRARRSRTSRCGLRRCPAGGRGGRPRRPDLYDPPNLTYPYGAYICVVDIDPAPRTR
jgi:carbon-monoxide dehydrogenase large subunit